MYENDCVIGKRDYNMLITVISEENGKVSHNLIIKIVLHVFNFFNFSFPSRHRKSYDILITF